MSVEEIIELIEETLQIVFGVKYTEFQLGLMPQTSTIPEFPGIPKELIPNSRDCISAIFQPRGDPKAISKLDFLDLEKSRLQGHELPCIFSIFNGASPYPCGGELLA